MAALRSARARDVRTGLIFSARTSVKRISFQRVGPGCAVQYVTAASRSAVDADWSATISSRSALSTAPPASGGAAGRTSDAWVIKNGRHLSGAVASVVEGANAAADIARTAPTSATVAVRDGVKSNRRLRRVMLVISTPA